PLTEAAFENRQGCRIGEHFHYAHILETEGSRLRRFEIQHAHQTTLGLHRHGKFPFHLLTLELGSKLIGIPARVLGGGDIVQHEWPPVIAYIGDDPWIRELGDTGGAFSELSVPDPILAMDLLAIGLYDFDAAVCS